MEAPDCEISLIEKNGANSRILILGDAMLDEYHYCKMERKTPEGPFLVWDLKREETRLGGAGNLAMNVAALGPKATLASVCSGSEVEGLASEAGLGTVFEHDGRQATVKRRFIDLDTGAMLAREDIESREPVSRATAAMVSRRIREDFGLIIYSDYGKGMFNPESIAEFLKIKAKLRIADVKPQNAKLFRGKVDIIKMNFGEFSELAKEYGEAVRNEDLEIERAGKKIRDDLKADLLITRSEKGMSYIGKECFHSPAEAKEVTDITGAGDTATAAFAAALSCGVDVRGAVRIANASSSIKVSKRGAVPVSLEEIRKKLLSQENKIISDKDISGIIRRQRLTGKKIAFTNGCFDILHHGHMVFLKKAREFGDLLVVALNSDSSVRKLKGAGRPKIPQHGRAEMLASFPFVDYVVIFDADTPEYLVEMLKPDVYVKGKDYRVEELPEARIVEGYGGRVELVDLVSEEGKKVSSSSILKGMR